MFQLRKYLRRNFKKTKQDGVEFDDSNKDKKVMTGCVYNCVASTLLLTTVHKCLGSEESSWWTFGRGISHSCQLCCIFQFTMRQICEISERSGLPACQISNPDSSIMMSFCCSRPLCTFQSSCCLSRCESCQLCRHWCAAIRDACFWTQW